MKKMWLTFAVCLLLSMGATYATYVAFQQDAAEAASWSHVYCPATTTSVPVEDPRHVVVRVDCPDGFVGQVTVVKAKYYEDYTTSVWSRDGTHWIEGEVKGEGYVTGQPYQGSGPLCAALLAILLVVSVGIVIDGYRRRKKSESKSTTHLSPA